MRGERMAQRAAVDEARDGEAVPVDALFDAAYRELRQLARARLAGGGRNTLLDTTRWCTRRF